MMLEFVTLRQCRGERRELSRFLAEMTGDRAGQRVENEVFAVLPDTVG